jgi:purine-binding chemotaxis protein CheW
MSADNRSLAELRSFDEDNDPSENVLQLAVFFVGRHRYGIDIMRIKRVIPAAPYPVREVPLTPPSIEGVITLRGVVIPVVDLRSRFSVPIDPDIVRFNKLVIVSVRGHIVSLKVDRVHGELRVPSDQVRPVPSMLSMSESIAEDFFSGVCKAGEDVVFVLNVERLIGAAQRVVGGAK